MSHERISPTAWLIAYHRTLSDIPLAPEIFHELEKIVAQERSAANAARVDALRSASGAIVWEARFKIINHVLKMHRPKQVLELAAGFSSRGLDLARDPSVTYVELDLPDLVKDKRQIVEALISQGTIPVQPNYHLVAGNALEVQDLLSASRFFAEEPIAVVNEGFLPYLDRSERTTLAKNILTLLERFGGMWITPDIDVQLPAETSDLIKARNAQTQRLTGIDILKNRFENEAAARTFFEELGFNVERHRFMEVADQLVSPEPPTELATKAVEQAVLYVMTAKQR